MPTTSTHHPLDHLRSELPATFSRTEITKLLGGIIAPGTVANEDSRGTGPQGLFFVGRRACYERDLFLDWLKGRVTNGKCQGPVGKVA